MLRALPVGFPLFYIVLVCLLAACGSTPEQISAPPSAPHPQLTSNVLLITVDALRADRLGCYGYSKAQTPAIDGLAKTGLRFSQAFTQSPLTLPSHATLMTGLYPAEHSLCQDGRYRLPEDLTTLAEVFHRRGFDTAAFIGGGFLRSWYGLNQGFVTYDDDFGNTQVVSEDNLVRPSPKVTDAVLAWLDKHATSANHGSFFCWVNFADPRLAEQPSPKDVAATPARYDQLLTEVDSQIARLIDALGKAGLSNNTVVVLLGVQGQALGDHSERASGMFLYSSTLHVPLIISAPGHPGSGREISAMVRLVDVFPTILDFQTWPLPDQNTPALADESVLHPRSLLSFTTSQDSPSRVSYARTDYPIQEFGWSELRSLTTDEFHYIQAPSPELYDLRADPNQTSNLAQTNPQQLARMKDMLLELERELPLVSPQQPLLSTNTREIIGSLAKLPENLAQDQHLPDSPLDPKSMISAYQAYLTGLDMLAKEDYSQALEQLTVAYQQSPASPCILAALSRAYQQKGQLDSAGKYLRLALARDPSSPALIAQMASLSLASEKYPQAVGYCQASLELKSIQPLVYNDLAVACYAQGKLPPAITALRQALSITPDYFDANFNLAVFLVQDDNPTAALGYFRAAAAAKPDSPQVFLEWGQLLFALHRYSEAADRFSRVLELEPENVLARHSLANILVLQNKNDQAITHYRTALQHAKPQEQAGLLQDLGGALVRLGHHQEAIPHLRQAIALQPDLAVAHCWLAQALLATGQPDEAVESFKQALRLSKDLPEARQPLTELALGRSSELAQIGRFDRAITMLREVHELVPANPALNDVLARYLATCPQNNLRDGRLAVTLAKEAVDATGRNKPQYLDTLAAAYAERADFKQAVLTAQEAIKVASEQGLESLMLEISARLDLYQQDKPYRQAPH